jgi:hypothetical protein
MYAHRYPKSCFHETTEYGITDTWKWNFNFYIANYNPPNVISPSGRLYYYFALNAMTRVHFHPQLVTSITRPPYRYEEDLALNFHYHVINCLVCTYRSLEFCSKGQQAARPILETFYMGSGGHVYSSLEKKFDRNVRVEIPLCFDTVFSFLLWDCEHFNRRSHFGI